MRQNKKGFTLIELLAVIVILGVIMAIAIPAMTGYINDSKKDSMVSTALNLLSAATDRITANNALPVSGQSVYMKVSDIELSKGGTSPYTNQKFTDVSVVRVTNTNGVYKYEIYLVDGNNNCLTASEAELNGATDAKRALVKTGGCTVISVPDGTTTIK